MRRMDVNSRYATGCIAALGLAGILIWWSVTGYMEYAGLAKGAVESSATGWIIGACIAAVMGGLFFVLSRLAKQSTLRIIRTNWDLAGEKVLLMESLTKLEETYVNTLHSLAAAVDANNVYAEGHASRVAECAVKIGRNMGLTGAELQALEEAALIHDIGKIWAPDHLLLKEGALSVEEREMVRMHPVLGAELLAAVHSQQSKVAAVLYHHERFDGTGYPTGLKGEAIPLEARVIAVADAFDRQTAKSIFRRASSDQEAFEAIYAGSGSRFDPQVVEAFMDVFDDLAQEEPERLLKKSFGQRLFNGVGNC